MPPKGKEKPAKNVEAKEGEEVRSVEVRVSGLMVDKLSDPVLSVLLPQEDEARRSPVLTECECFEGEWRSKSGTHVTLKKEGEGMGATCTKLGLVWRTQQVLKVGETTPGEVQTIISASRSMWLPCEVKAENTCELLVNGEPYLRTGLHAFAFATTLFTLDSFIVTTEAIKTLFAVDLTLQVILNDPSTRSTEATAQSDKKAKAKTKAVVPETEKALNVYDSAPFNLVPLVMGHTQTEVKWELSPGSRQPLQGFASLKLTITSSDEAKHKAKLLSPLQENHLMPMCVSVTNITNIPDSRPVAISRTEDPIERPFVDTIASQTPCYEDLRRRCKGVYVSCAMWPNSTLSSYLVSHEQSPGVHYNCLYLLGEIAEITQGAIPDMLGLVKYLFNNVLKLQLHDRDTDAVPGFGVAPISLRPLLYDDAQQPTLCLREQVTPYRAAIDAEGDDNTVVKRTVPQGQYLSWNTTVAVRIALATPMPKVTFSLFLLNLTAARVASAASVAMLAVSLFADPTQEPTGFSPRRVIHAPPVRPLFTRLIIRLSYAKDSTRPVLHALMAALQGMQKVTKDDDVVMYTPSAAPPPEVEEVADPKKKGKPSAANVGPSPPVEAPPEDPTVLQVMCSEAVSGFEVIDGEVRILVFEGMTWSLGTLLDALHDNVKSSDLRSGAVSVVFNPCVGFPNRAYHIWPKLVADIPEPKKVMPDNMDAGGVGGRIRRIRLERTLADISGTQRNYVKRRVSEGVFRSVKNLNALRSVETMQTATDLNLFPSADDIIALERMYGTTLSSYDVCGSVVFSPFTQPLPSPEVVTCETVQQEASEGEGAPTSLADLDSLMDRDVVVIGRPAGPAHGRRAKIEAAVSVTGASTCWLYVPQFDDVILLLLQKMPKPVKTVKLEVEGRLVKVENTTAVQVYRWREVNQGQLHGTLTNTAFLLKKNEDSRKLGYTHYRTVQQQITKNKRVELEKRRRNMEKELEGESSEGEADACFDVFLPPVVPAVSVNYKYTNANKFKGSRRPMQDGTTPELPASPKVPVFEGASAAFQQLRGGWRQLCKDEVRKGLEVRTVDKQQGKVLSFTDTTLTLRTKKGEAITKGYSKVEVNAKCALMDNTHPLKPTQNRIEDLSCRWAPAGNPFERKVTSGKDFQVPKSNRPFSSFSPDDTLAVDVAQDAARRRQEEKKAWEDKVVVESMIFKVNTSKRNHPIDKQKGMLVDKPVTRSHRKLSPEAPPLSIHKPADTRSAKREVSTVYYPGKSHKWQQLENKNKPRIKPLLESEKTGPQW